jgi:chitinase
MGVPFYGRYWKNVGDPVDPNDGMWRIANAVNGKFEGGFEQWKTIKSKWLGNPDNKVTMHEKSKTPYIFNDKEKTFLGFENPESLKYKVEYAEKHNLGYSLGR